MKRVLAIAVSALLLLGVIGYATAPEKVNEFIHVGETNGGLIQICHYDTGFEGYPRQVTGLMIYGHGKDAVTPLFAIVTNEKNELVLQISEDGTAETTKAYDLRKLIERIAE